MTPTHPTLATLPTAPGQWHARIASLTWPTILANLTIPLVGVADTAVMGRLPDPAYIGAVAVGSTVFTGVYWLFGFLRMGTTGLASQAYGRGEFNHIAAISLRAFLVAAVLGILMVALQTPFASLAFQIIQGSDRVEQLASEYLFIRIWSAPAVMLNLVAMGTLFGLQRMRTALALGLTLNATNLGLDVLFVVGFGWGVSGVAIGTLVSEWLAAALGAWLVIRTLKSMGWRPAATPKLIDPARLGELFRVSGNLILRTFFVQMPFLTLTAVSASMGDVLLAANAVLMQLYLVMTYGLDGFAHTAETLAGYCFGAHRAQDLRRATGYSAVWAGVTALLIAACYALAGDALVALLTGSDEVRHTASVYLPWLVAAPIVCVWAFLLDGVFIGTTHIVEMRNSMFLAAAIWALTLWLALPALGNHGVWLAMTVFMFARSLLLTLYYPRLERNARVAGTDQRAPTAV